MRKGKKKTMKINTKRVAIASIIFFLFSFGLTSFFKSYGEFVSRLTRENSGVSGDTVYVNDAEADLNYYLGLNYTYTSDGTLPNGTKNNYYNENNLVETKVLYSGTDINYNNLTGYVSNLSTERQSKYIYYKYYPVNDNGTSSKTDDYILIELIDSPYAYRPNGKGFNGWVTNYNGVEIYLDSDYYTRYAKVPVTYTNNIPDVVNITFNASWIDAAISTITSNNSYTWSTALSGINNRGMMQLENFRRYTYLPFDMTGYYVREVIPRYGSCAGYYNNYNQLQGNNCTCNRQAGCTYYRKINGEYLDESLTYYEYDYGMSVVDIDDLPREVDQVIYINGYFANMIMAGYYTPARRTNGQSVEGLYNNNGVLQHGSCSGTCNYYELIQYRDDQNNISYIDGFKDYYYLVTRDTNIIVLDANISNRWSSTTKPFTFTALDNGTNSGAKWTIGSTYINVYSDVRIEHMTISSGQTRRSANPPSSNSSTRTLYGKAHNLKIGRGITQNGTYTNFSTIVGGTNDEMGSSRSDVEKYKLIIESGVYNAISLTNGALSNTYSQPDSYLEVKGVYGNDYDRVVEGNNDNLNVYYCASGSWGGDYYASTNTGITFDLTVKNGVFGDLQSDNTNGIYVGGRYGGVHYTSRRAKIEGGYIFNLIGGPLTASNRKTINDSYIYVTGGEVDMIIGGAGQTATHGNRIIQVTGGTINYSVFGGSNGSDGSEGDGTVNGSSFIYIGGDAEIGNEDYVEAYFNDESDGKLWGAEAGSVFGIGNGKSGSSTIGSSDNSHIIIADSAHVRNSVYGGGNFGATGVSSSNNSTTSKIDIIGGTIDKNVYGGGNNNGSGSSSKESTITINMYDGTVKGSIYGGSNEMGTVYGNVNVNVKGGTVDGSVYGGGQGGYTNNRAPGTFVTKNVNVTIGDSSLSSTPTINTNVYGGSAFGTVNGDVNSNANNVSSYDTHVTVNKGTINGSVFGGGQGDDDFTPKVLGDVEVKINNGTIKNVYGGNDAKGTPNGTIDVYINGGTVTNTFGGGNLAPIKTSTVYLNGGTSTNVYGGSNAADATTTNVKLQGGSATTIFGGSNQSGTVTTANITTTSGSATTIFGRNNLGGSTTTANVTINGGNVTTVYGGGNEASTGTTTVNLKSSSVTTVYGGGNKAGVTTGSNVNLQGSSVTTIYGGSNQSGTVNRSNIVTTSGSATTIFGGNNLGGSTTTANVTANGGTIGTIYGGGNEATTESSNVDLKSGTITDVYGGGNKAGVTNGTVVNLQGSTVTNNIFGGSNQSGDITTTTITATSGSAANIYGGNNKGGTTTTSNITTSGGTIGTIYGGNNLGGTTTTSNITVNGASINTIYGGGNEATTGTTNVHLNSSTIASVYGGGNKAGVTNSTNVDQNGSTVTNLYGGSNQSGTVAISNIVTTGGTTTNIYGGNNQGGTTTTTNVTTNGGTITNIFGGGNEADSTTTNVNINRLTGTTANVYGGGNKASVSNANVTIKNNVKITNVYGGSNQSGTVASSNVSLPYTSPGPQITAIFGGNNQGGSTVNASVDINCGTIGAVYGGGNYASTGVTNTTIKRATVTGNVFGGGNQAAVDASSTLKLDGATVNGNVFGGGNLGTIGTNTSVHVTDSIVGKSLFAGGNGVSATVIGNTLLNVDGATTVTNHVFGGGNAAQTGTEENNNSTSILNITGLSCGGNVYGGANTSVLYGIADVNIGKNVATDSLLKNGDINIAGTVFGGGEANASGSDIYDFSFISVTTGITIDIDAQGHSNFNIGGSIFGSGNASSTDGYSYIYIKNYGTEQYYKKNVSIQRAQVVTIDNCAFELTGATDRTNEYSDVLFSLSRIDELKLVNNSILYLENSTNLVKKFTSAKITNGVETKAAVTFDDNGNATRNVNNKIFIYEGRNINIATNESVTAYGEVSGMTFFGMYSHDRLDNVDTGYYKTIYNNTSTIPSSELTFFSNGSYVLGAHNENHNYEVDGFYSNFPVKDSLDKLTVNYIEPTPEDSDYYMWVIGEPVELIEIFLTASKYSTLGAYELSLVNYSAANTTFSVLGFNYNELDGNVNLLEKDDIPRVADSGSHADNNMALVLKTSDNGWITKGSTTFITDDSNEEGFIGKRSYLSENSNAVPSLLFYLYHSKNLETAGDMGSVMVSMVAIRPLNDLNNEVKRVNIKVYLSRAIYSTDDYEGTMTPGKVYEMFAPNTVNITSTSSFTSYYSLFMEKNETPYKPGSHRVLSSTFNLPANTKITMIDLLSGTTPEYYYYVVSPADYAANTIELQNQGDVSYRLDKFIRMGSSNPNNHYDDVAKNLLYYNTSNHIAEEEFIFIVDFQESGITEDVLRQSLVLELHGNQNEVLLTVIGVEQQQLYYNLYANKDSVIHVQGTMETTDVYVGEQVGLLVETNFTQPKVNSNVIIDTNFYDYRSGIKISILDSNGTVVNGPSIMGISYTLNGETYYPRFDGTVRINVAERIANVSSNIKINTEGSNLASGNYTLVIESFGSPDGIYYGLISSDRTEIPFTVKNTLYGLKVVANEEQLLVNKQTGITEDGANAIAFNFQYSSGLTNPNIRVSLLRRDYNEIYSNIYNLVDLKDYFTNDLSTTNREKVYMLFDTPQSTMSTVLYLKENLTSGTYRIVFGLYDNNTFIGDVHKYIIIK